MYFRLTWYFTQSDVKSHFSCAFNVSPWQRHDQRKGSSSSGLKLPPIGFKFFGSRSVVNEPFWISLARPLSCCHPWVHRILSRNTPSWELRSGDLKFTWFHWSMLQNLAENQNPDPKTRSQTQLRQYRTMLQKSQATLPNWDLSRLDDSAD